jgi:hypothetical protein
MWLPDPFTIRRFCISDHATSAADVQSQILASQVRVRLISFLAPLLRTLDRQLDRRLVLTFCDTLQARLI